MPESVKLSPTAQTMSRCLPAYLPACLSNLACLPALLPHPAQERLGLMFSDNRRDSHLVVYFPLAMVLRDLIAGLLIGVQEGEWCSTTSCARG